MICLALLAFESPGDRSCGPVRFTNGEILEGLTEDGTRFLGLLALNEGLEELGRPRI